MLNEPGKELRVRKNRANKGEAIGMVDASFTSIWRFNKAAHERPNDEVKRRAGAPTQNEADSSQSSTASLAHRRRHLAISRTGG